MEASALQLKIKNACISVETRFVTPMNRGAYFWRAVPAALILATLAFAPLSQMGAVGKVVSALSLPLALLSCYVGIESSARRFRDLGEKGTKVLQILVPLFVCSWLGPKLPGADSTTGFVALRPLAMSVLCLWPAVVFLRLLFTSSRS